MKSLAIPLRPLRSLREKVLFHAKLANYAKTRKIKIAAISLLAISCSATAAAQMARKPSPSREPSDFVAVNKTNKNSLPKIASQADFDSIARVYHQGTPYA